MNQSTRSVLKPPRRGKSIGFVEMNTASSSPGTGASHWSNYTGPNFAVTSTSLHAAGAASAGLGIVSAT